MMYPCNFFFLAFVIFYGNVQNSCKNLHMNFCRDNLSDNPAHTMDLL